MTDSSSPSRRTTMIAALAAASGAGLVNSASAQPASTPRDPALVARAHDWDWLVGTWNVRHHRLKARLAGSTEWEDFDGTSTMWLTLDGLGTVDDNWIDIPSGAYRAVGVRAYDAASGKWLIWWLDGRMPTSLDPPVRGNFSNGVGEFIADDTLDNRPIKVRFRWSDITATSARWEQAFSPDAGATWEVNWVMHFTRAT